MDQKKTGWVAEFRGLLGRMLSPTQTTEPSPDGDGPGAAGLGAEARDTLRFLVKVGQVDGRFDEIERSFTLESLREAGHRATEQDLEEIAAETRFRGASEIVRPFRAHPLEFRERLLRTGVLLAAASGRVTSDEHKALREACHELDLPRETLDLLVKAAIEAPGRELEHVWFPGLVDHGPISGLAAEASFPSTRGRLCASRRAWPRCPHAPRRRTPA